MWHSCAIRRRWGRDLTDDENGLLTLFALQKKKVASARAADQKAIDKTLLANIKKEEFVKSYLASTFSLRNGDKPHEMKW